MTPKLGEILNRRDLLRLLGIGVVASQTTGSPVFSMSSRRSQVTDAKVVVVGGGPGGITVARTIRTLSPNVDVTLIERQPRIATCYFSNHYLGGLRTLESITHSLSPITDVGINLVEGTVASVDRDKRNVMLENGDAIPYDRLVLSPGVEMDTATIEGYARDTWAIVPHAWTGGGQSKLLRSQLEAMPDGGTFIIAPPALPYRCPPAPYERASLVAHYFKTHKPRSKILILDGKTGFPNQELFEQVWDRFYPGMIEWIPVDFIGNLKALHPNTMHVYTEGGWFKGDVINIIPPQRAGSIAQQANLAGTDGWCPIDPMTFRSELDDNIYVVGDSIAGHLPKAASTALDEGAACGMAVVSDLSSRAITPAPVAAECWSLVAPTHALFTRTTYQAAENGFNVIATKGSSYQDDDEQRGNAAQSGEAWYKAVTEMLYGAT